MSLPADFRIWIIEDMVDETQKYYLRPLEQIAKSRRDGRFPQVHVILLNLNDDDREEVVAIINSVSEEYPATQPKLYLPNPEHEKSPEIFFTHLQNLTQDQDILLVDPTVCGSSWAKPPDNKNFLNFVFNKVVSWKSPARKDRVLLVSNFTRLHKSSPYPGQWEDLQKITIPKFDRDMDEYRGVLQNHLEPFLTPPSDWTKHLNEQGRETLVPFVEQLRQSEDYRRTFDEIGESAKWAIIHLTSPAVDCARDIIEATDGEHYYDPESADKTSHQPFYPRRKGMAKLYDILIRRHILYGLRKLWEECNPSEKKYVNEYKLWLEIVAAGYFWYSNEIEAVRGIIGSLKTPKLTLSPDNTIDLRPAGLEFIGKESVITESNVRERKFGVRRQEGKRGYIRYIEGDISFNHPGETTKNKSNYRFKVRFGGNRLAVPSDESPERDWNSFWGISNQGVYETRQKEFTVEWEGRAGKLQTELSHRCRFLEYSYLLTFRDPMPEEEEWWLASRELICQRVTRKPEGLKNFNPFDPIDQSEAKFSKHR